MLDLQFNILPDDNSFVKNNDDRGEVINVHYVYNILDNQVGEETGEWLDTFALVTECTDAKFCNTTNQVQGHRYLLSARA